MIKEKEGINLKERGYTWEGYREEKEGKMMQFYCNFKKSIIKMWLLYYSKIPCHGS